MTQMVAEGSRWLVCIPSASLLVALGNWPRASSCADAEKASPLEVFLSYIYAGDEDMVKQMMAKGMRAEVKDKENWTPLRLASQQGHESIVALLLEEQVDVNLRPDGEDSALMLAAINGHAGVIKQLAMAGGGGAMLEARSTAQNA